MMQLLTQNVLNYPESLETADILRSVCCFLLSILNLSIDYQGDIIYNCFVNLRKERSPMINNSIVG